MAYVTNSFTWFAFSLLPLSSIRSSPSSLPRHPHRKGTLAWWRPAGSAQPPWRGARSAPCPRSGGSGLTGRRRQSWEDFLRYIWRIMTWGTDTFWKSSRIVSGTCTYKTIREFSFRFLRNDSSCGERWLRNGDGTFNTGGLTVIGATFSRNVFFSTLFKYGSCYLSSLYVWFIVSDNFAVASKLIALLSNAQKRSA